MKIFIILLFAGIAITCAEPGVPDVGGLLGAGLLTGVTGGLLGGKDGATSLVAGGNGVTAGLLSAGGALLDVGLILGLKNLKCLKKCPTQIVDTSLKCILPTTFPRFPICYGQNTKMKYIWPCQTVEEKKKNKNKKKKQKKDD